VDDWNESTVRVWVDDRHPIFRRGLVTSLAADGMQVIGESAGLTPAPDLGAVDVVVFEAVEGALAPLTAATASTPVRIVAVAPAHDEHLLYEAVEAGAGAVLVRNDLDAAGLVAAVRAVAAGNTAVPATLMPRLLQHAVGTGRGGPRSLTARELAVLRLLSQGSETRDIGDELGYSERTVKNVVHDVLMKLNCRNRAHVVGLATRQGLI
jgi:DNA-binding NarL/FixJ family response regulator